LKASGLSPWQEGDALEAFSAGAGSLEINFFGAQFPQTGDTSLQLTTDAENFYNAHAIDGSKGDKLVVAHMSGRAADAFGYESVSQTFTPPAFTQADGQPMTVEGTFQDVEQQHLMVSWDQPAFAALASQVNPDAQLISLDLSLYAEAGGTHSTWPNPDLIFGSVDATMTPPQQQSLDLTYGNPYSATWPLYLCMNGSFATKAIANWSFSVSTCTKLANAGAKPVSPVVGPPRNLQVNGKPAGAAMSGTGDSPVIHWDAPSLGTPAAYGVDILQKDETGDFNYITDITTSGTSVTVPPGIIQPGLPYFILLDANSKRNLKSPGRFNDESSFAQTISGVLMP
jgi:hypothetical protein